MPRRAISAALVLGAASWGGGADLAAQAPKPHYSFDVWTSDDGLPQDSITSIAQTRDGYLWVGTLSGLARFDGVSFSVFNRRRFPEMKDDEIQALAASADGGLWVGTSDGGVLRWKEGRFSRLGTAEGLSSEQVRCLLEDRQGVLWVGTLRGLDRVKDGRVSVYTTAEGLPHDGVTALYEDRDGALWAGTRGGLVRIDHGRLTVYTPRAGLAHDIVRWIAQDSGGALWISTNVGLNRLLNERFTLYTPREGLSGLPVGPLLAGRDGALWIGAGERGLDRFDGTGFTSFSTHEGLSSNVVRSLYEDQEGSLWVGTVGGGLNRLRKRPLTAYTSANGLPMDYVLAVHEDRRGRFWFGTGGGGLARLDRNGNRTYRVADGLTSDYVEVLLEGRDGTLWVGGARGLAAYREGRFVAYTGPGLQTGVKSLGEDGRGTLWIGTNAGLSTLRDGNVTAYQDGGASFRERVRAIHVARDESLWVASESLRRQKDGRWTRYSTEHGLSHDIVSAIHEDSDGVLWLGTKSGLSRFRDGGFTRYTSEQGLFDEAVVAIQEDARGNLWLSASKGLFRVSKQQLADVADRRARRVIAAQQDVAGVVRTRQLTKASARSRDGRLWFGTRGGVVVLDPADDEWSRVSPTVSVEEIIVDKVSRAPGSELTFPPGSKEIEIHYRALSLREPAKIRFRYRLEGVETAWVDAGNRRVAFYSNLPAGRHSFRVTACNDHGVWNEQGASLSFRLEPRFSETTWFKLLLAGASLLMGFGLYRLRLRQVSTRLAAILEERSRIARELHDTLAQGFAALSVQLENVADTQSSSPALAREYLDECRRLVRLCMDEARRSVLNLRSAALEREDLAGVLSRAARQLTADSGVQAEVSVSGAPRRLPEAVESDLFRIGQEGLINALRHARARKVRIDLAYELDRVVLCVRDDGCGFQQAVAAHAEPHFGLLGMRERVERLRGELNVNSRSGEGTEITVAVPLN